MFSIKTAVIKRPAFWTFLGAGVALGSVYFVQEKVDPILLLDFVKAFLALIGLGGLVSSGLNAFKAWKESQNG